MIADPQAIACELNKAQRKWLICLGREDFPGGCFVDGQKDDLASLVSLNLVERVRKPGWRRVGYRILPPGLAIRNVLVREGGADNQDSALREARK